MSPRLQTERSYRPPRTAKSLRRLSRRDEARARLSVEANRLTMPLNHVSGEVLNGYDPIFRVVPPSKYAEQTRLTTIVEELRGKKFQRKVKVQRSIRSEEHT